MLTLRRRFSSAVLVLTVAAMASSGLVQPTAAFTSPDSYLRLWASTNGGGPSEQEYTKAEAVEVARRYDTVVALRWTFRDYVSAMKSANARLTLLTYMNGAFAKDNEGSAFPDAWYLRDEQGRKVRSSTWGNFLMDTGHTGWRDKVVRECADAISYSGYDGCYLDDLGAGNLGTTLTGWPVNPRTGKRYTESQWVADNAALAGIVEDSQGRNPVIPNGLNNGNNYFGPAASVRLLDATDGGNAEGWLRGAHTPIDSFRSEDSWQRDVDMLVDAGVKGKSIVAMTKIWTSATNSQVERWRRYAYASFLLGTNGQQYLYFNPQGPGKPPAAHALDSIDIGEPVSSYGKSGAAYVRHFSNGIALVNPTGSSVTVDLAGGYVDINGNTMSSITLASNTGQVLVSEPASNDDASGSNGICGGATLTIVGTEGDDVITGTAGPDVIDGLGGNDVVYGGEENDIICGGDGNDRLHGGPGNDLLIGGAGQDDIYSGGGDDELRGNGNDDQLFGYGGNDILLGGAGYDACDGGSGTDWAKDCESASNVE